MSIPETYAVSKLRSAGSSTAWEDTIAFLGAGDDTIAAYRALAAVPDFDHASWPMQMMVVRYPGNLVESNDGGNDGCGCSGEQAQVMTCDPDGYSRHFMDGVSRDGYFGPPILPYSGENGFGHSQLEGDDGCPICDNPKWELIPNSDSANSRLPEIFGSLNQIPAFDPAYSKGESILSEAIQMPFESSIIYVMTCDPD